MPSEVYLMPFLSAMASVVLVIASLYWAKAVLIPLALALMLTFLLQPIVAALHRRGLGLFCFGLPYALLWGLLAGALRFIPYVGPAVGAVLPLALSLASHLARLGLDSIACTSTTLPESCSEILQVPPPHMRLVPQAGPSVVLGQADGVVRRGP